MLLVPFDGSELARTALVRAREFGDATDKDLLVLIVVPPDEVFARNRGWITASEAFDPKRVGNELETAVNEIASDVTVRIEATEEASLLASTEMDISRTIRQVAHETDASVVFIGSENAGRVTSPVTSVGTPVSKDPGYDVYIVRHAD